MTGKEFGKYKDIIELRDKAIAHYTDNIAGRIVETEIGPVLFGKNSFKKPKSNLETNKLLLFYYLPEIVSKGRLVRRDPDRKGRKNIKEWFLLETPVKIGNQHLIARVNIRLDNNGTMYYDHAVKKEMLPGNTPHRINGTGGPESSLYENVAPDDEVVNIMLEAPPTKVNAEAASNTDWPVITLTGKEFGKYKNIKDLRGRISGMFFETLQGGAINREGFGKVRMSEKALRETLDNARDDELLPVKYIPDIIRKGSLGNEEILKSPREDGIVSLTPIMARMKDTNGKETSVGVMIGKDEKGRLYYDSFIIK